MNDTLAHIRTIFAQGALVAFLLVELFSFIRGHSLETILIRGLGVYGGIIILGWILTRVIEAMKLTEIFTAQQEEPKEKPPVSTVDINVDDAFGGKEGGTSREPEYNPLEEIKDAVAKNPKEIAGAIKKMIRR